jgi:hypothetical protein
MGKHARKCRPSKPDWGLGSRFPVQFDCCYLQRNWKSFSERTGDDRGGAAAGFAAAFAKIGAVATAFLFPALFAAFATPFPALRAYRRL